jgi:hypothetical protein
MMVVVLLQISFFLSVCLNHFFMFSSSTYSLTHAIQEVIAVTPVTPFSFTLVATN